MLKKHIIRLLLLNSILLSQTHTADRRLTPHSARQNSEEARGTLAERLVRKATLALGSSPQEKFLFPRVPRSISLFLDQCSEMAYFKNKGLTSTLAEQLKLQELTIGSMDDIVKHVLEKADCNPWASPLLRALAVTYLVQCSRSYTSLQQSIQGNCSTPRESSTEEAARKGPLTIETDTMEESGIEYQEVSPQRNRE